MREKKIPDLVLLGIISGLAIILLLTFPEKQERVITASWEFFIEMMLILPAVMILMGLFSVFVPKELVVKYLGKESGVKGVFIAILMGSLPTGPLYIAFPIASALLKKGARVLNVIAFLSAWSCIKLPQEMVELEFLGLNFMLARLALTVIFVIFMGLALEKMVGGWELEYCKS